MKTSSGAFTLIEVLVVVLLIGVLASIATPSYLTWTRNKRLDDALLLMEGALNEARQEAIRKSQSCRFSYDVATKVLSARTDTTSPQNCLPTGSRDLGESNRSLLVTTDFNALDDTRALVFTPRGSTINEGIVVLSDAEASYQRCLVVSSGAALIRKGYYDGDPMTPSLNNCKRDRV